MIDKFNNIVSGDIPEYGNNTTLGNSHTTDDAYYQQMLPLDIYSLHPTFHRNRSATKQIDTSKGIKIIDEDIKKIKNDLLKLAVGNVTELDFFRNYKIKNKELIKKILKFVKSKNNLNEANSKLKGRKTTVPNYIIRKINEEIKNLNGEKPNGYQFAQNITKNPSISYENIKRKINIFNNLKDLNSLEARLMGGQEMLDFLNKTLQNWRSYVKNKNNAKDKAGFHNVYIKTHEKS